MKKILIMFTVLLLMFALAGCGKNRASNTDQAANNNATTTNNNDTPTVDNNLNESNNDGKLSIADDVASNITSLNDVENATVLVTNNNAYVGAMLKEGVEGTSEIENQIADEVRKTSDTFENVYVSLNPDFAKQLTDYGDKIRAGEPIEGLFDEFTDTVERIFPNAK